ncbi:MAG: DUF2589 domain-containing protein [Syntrophaceticus sp.]|nr:DUF2589 domain-containing protein [Syntrophaceticus sp.]MDD4360012.1 DUF2589 domain-containing protein [Syntrophaceticus sp.]MDD4783264.1 DUF2589 domain-containing protein [Syntrophaceticus sp.]
MGIGRELASLDFKNLIGGPLIAVIEAQAQAAMSSVDFIKAVGFKPGEEGAVTGEPIYVSFKYPKEVKPYEPEQPSIINIVLMDGGEGYGDSVTVTISGGSPKKVATAEATVSEGKITSITVTDQGQGYTSKPTVTISGMPEKDAEFTVEFTPYSEAKAAVFSQMVLEVPILTMLPIPFIRVEETTIDFNAKINSVTTSDTASKIGVDSSTEAKAKYFGFSAKLNVSTSYQRTTNTGSKVDRTYSMAVHVRAVQDEMPAGMEKLLGILEDAIKSQPASLPSAAIQPAG